MNTTAKIQHKGQVTIAEEMIRHMKGQLKKKAAPSGRHPRLNFVPDLIHNYVAHARAAIRKSEGPRRPGVCF